MPASTLPPETLPLSPVKNATTAAPSGDSLSRWGRHVSGARIAVSRGLLAVVVGFCLVTSSSWLAQRPIAAGVLVTAGLLLTGVGAAGRLWCSLYIAGYKDRRLVTDGPYSVCRHPLYFFSFLGLMGAAMTSGTITIPLLLAVIFLFGYQPVMEAEEGKLRALFGVEHDHYQERVPRLFPKWRLLAHAPSWTSSPAVFFRHATSVVWFPAAAGLMLMLPALRAVLHLPVLLRIP